MTAPSVSFEFFPPKSLEASFRLWDTVQALAPLDPSFVSVTYGAGGTTRELTRDAVATLHKTSGLNVAAHLTCVDASREETLAIADTFAEAGVNEIVALRGDPPKGSGGFTPHPDGFSDSCELISALAETGKFKIRVGAYPEKHPEAADPGADVDYLKRKFDAGADEAITQFFFEADTFFRFRDACDKAGITAPILPGIMPLNAYGGFMRMTGFCKTRIPPAMKAKVEELKADEKKAEFIEFGLDYITAMCHKLVASGLVPGLHFYSLNQSERTFQLLKKLGYYREC